ncbi:MAG: protein TolR [Pseudomonadota bacterium]
MKPQTDFRVGPRRKLLSDINVVPYIDVMLVLLVVFMITAPMMTQGVKVDLPDADAEPINIKNDEPLVVSVQRDGSYRLSQGGKPLGSRSEAPVSMADVVARAGAVRRQKPDTLVLVEGDDAVPYGRVVALMAALQKAGVNDVGLVTEPDMANVKERR